MRRRSQLTFLDFSRLGIMRHTILLVLVAWTFARGQDMPTDDIVPLTSANLTEGRSQAQKIQITGSFWIAYGVRVKPNLAIDTHEVNVPWDPSIHGPDVSVNVNPSTPELGIFIRYVASKEAEIEVLNLRRKHHFGAIPVFWLGQEPDGESLDFLQALLKTRPDLATGLVRAIGIHRDERSADVLKAQAMLSTLSKRAHEEALCWIGQSYGQSSFLYHIANNATLALDERSAAVLALLESPDPAAQEVIARFRSQVNERRIQDLIDRYRRGGTKSTPQTTGPKL